MKKIRSQEEAERRNRINRMIIGVLLIFLMLASTLGYAFFSSSGSDAEEIQEENLNGQFVNGRWVYQIEEQQFGFLNFIGLAEKVPVSIENDLNTYYRSPLYVDSQGNPEVLEEIRLNLERYSSRFQEACYDSCESNLPEKGCESNLIVYRNSSENRVYQQDGCIFIEGDMTAVDAFLYKILGFI